MIKKEIFILKTKLIKSIAKIFNLNKLDLLYTNKFYIRNKEKRRRDADLLTTTLLKQFEITSVLDFGCGNGLYLKSFELKCIEDIFGVDGSKNARNNFETSKSKFKLFDLTKDLYLGRKFDLSLSIEVAEHISEKDSNVFVTNLCRHSNLVVLTAAPPGQGGTDHINEQPKEYWIEKFAQRGYKYDISETELISKELENQKAIWWLYKNLMIFKKEEISAN